MPEREVYDLEVMPLTPIHIGTGEDIMPLEYTIKPKLHPRPRENTPPIIGGTYVRFSPATLLNTNESKIVDFEKIIGDVLALRKFFNDLYDECHECRLHEPLEVSQKAASHFNEKLNAPGGDNLLFMKPFIRPPGGDAYIPGSSVKGMLRGAWMSGLWKESEKRLSEGDYKSWAYRHEYKDPVKKTGAYITHNNIPYNEKELLGLFNQAEFIQHNPFKILKVGDSTGLDLSSDFNPIPTIIMLAEGLPRNNAQESSRNSKGYASKKSTGMLQTLTEYIPGKLLPNGQEFTIHHRLVIDKDLEHKWQLPNYMDRDNKDGTDITCESIVKRCKELFVRQYDKDKAYFNQSKNIDSETNDTMTKLKEEFDSIESDPIQCIARLGWGSGFDAMSLNSVLDQQHSFTPITRKLADGKYPQGWVKLKFEKL